MEEIIAKIITLMQAQNKSQATDQWIMENFTNLSTDDCDEIAKHMRNMDGVKIARYFGGDSRFVIDIAGFES